MKVLWITNILFPEAKSLICGESDFKASGGWMLGAAESLIKYSNIKLYVATVSSNVDKLTTCNGKDITYYLIPLGKGNIRVNDDYIPYWKKINNIVSPDVIHIHGTEYSHGYAYIQACGSKNVVVSIQGLLSAISPYYCYGIKFIDCLRYITLRDLFFGGLLKERKMFAKRGEYEIGLLKNTEHIIGRTSWDRARSWAINPRAEYYFCNEILRSDFYMGEKWDYDKCKKYSIFVSQAGKPLKGFHQVLKAMPLILRHYPDTTIRIAGSDITCSSSIKQKLLLSGYGLILKRIITKYKLKDKIVFTGRLSAQQMKMEYLNANVFILPSAIENSPNSLGEAQILGVPCIASYVGGVMDMMKGNENFLYRFEEFEMLAYKVCEIFGAQGKQEMQESAKLRHSQKNNTEMLINIYKKIANK